LSRLSEIRDRFSDWYGWEGDKLAPVDFVMAAWHSTFLTGDRERTFGYLCGAGSGGKTSILETVRDSDPIKGEPEGRTVWVTDMTENAFASGFRPEGEPDKDPSLLARLDCRRKPEGNKVLVVQDMGNILGLSRDRRSRFFNQMRSAYDRAPYDNATGSVGRVSYNLNFGFLGAATETLDDVLKYDQPLGQRAVICRMNPDGTDFEYDRNIAARVIESDPYKKDRTLIAIRELVQSHLKTAREEVEAVDEYRIVRPKKYVSSLSAIHTLACRIRTVPISANTMTHDAEKPPRIAGQLTTWGDARASFDGRLEWNDEDFAMMRRIAQDTMNPEFLKVLRALWGKGPEDAAKAKSVRAIQYGCSVEQSLERQFRQWALCGLVVELDRDCYAFKSCIIDAIAECDFFAGLRNPLDK